LPSLIHQGDEVSNPIEETERNKTGRSETRNNQDFDLREETRKSIEQGFAMLRSNAEKAVNLSLKGWSAAHEEGASCLTMLMDASRANAASATSLMKDLAGIKAPSDVVAITHAHAKRQMELITAHNRHLWTSAQKLVNAISLPLKAES
jgi:hypothetical protein